MQANRLTASMLMALSLGLSPAAHGLNVTWNVAGGGDWDTTTANWTGDNTFYTEGDNATFNNTAGGTINLTANRAPGSTTVSAASGTYIFSNNNITAGNLSKSGGGTLQLDSQYTFGGTVSVTGGTLKLGASNRIADTANIGGGGTFDMNGFDETLRWAGSGAVTTTNMGNLTVTHGFADRSGVGIMSGSGSLTFGTGHGTSIIRDTHLYTGGTFINNGFVALYGGNSNQLPIAGNVSIATGAIFSLDWHNGSGNTRTIAGLSGTGSVQSSNNNLSNHLLQVGNGGASSTWGGIFSGAGSLEKIGSGTLNTTGNNSYTGTTTVTAGTLLVNGLTGPNQSNYSVAAAGTLGGSGTIRLNGASAVTVNGTLAPGNSIGTLTINGDLTLNAGASLEFELASPGSGDQVTVNGDLVLDGTLDVTQLAGFTNGTYTLFSYTGTLTDNGLNVVDPENNYSLLVGGGQVQLLVENLVPEPSTLALIGLGLAGMAARARRRK